MEAVTVEVLNRLGRARARQRLDTFPATFGRSPACHVILDERDVSAVHARLVRADDGALVLEDAGSANGLFVGKAKVPRVVLGRRTEVRLGSARLRFLAKDAPVEKTFVGAAPTGGAWAAWGAGALGVLALQPFAHDLLRNPWAPDPAESALLGLLLVGAVLLWAFAWALASRIFQGQLRYSEHVWVSAATASVGVLLNGWLVPFAGFALQLTGTLRLLAGALNALCITWLLAEHLRRASNWSLWRVRLLAFGLVGSVVAMVWLEHLSSLTKPSGTLPLQDSALPPAFLLRQVKTPDDLFSQLPALQTEVDALRDAP